MYTEINILPREYPTDMDISSMSANELVSSFENQIILRHQLSDLNEDVNGLLEIKKSVNRLHNELMRRILNNKLDLKNMKPEEILSQSIKALGHLKISFKKDSC